MSQVQWLESNLLYLCFLSYPAQLSDTLCQIQRTPLCIHLPIPHSHTDKYFRKQTELITSWHPCLLLLTQILFHDLIRALVLGSFPPPRSLWGILFYLSSLYTKLPMSLLGCILPNDSVPCQPSAITKKLETFPPPSLQGRRWTSRWIASFFWSHKSRASVLLVPSSYTNWL